MRIVPILLSILLAACAGTNDSMVRVTLSAFEDDYYPCAKVVFPEAISYKGEARYNLDNETLLVHTLKIPAMPQHSVQIIKRHTNKSFVDWAQIPLPDQYEEREKLYERGNEEISDAEKSAVLRFVNVEGNINLRAVVGIFPRMDTGLIVIAERTVQKKEYVHLFSLEKWKVSSRGQAITEDMKKWTDWFYDHTELVSCTPMASADEWWK